METNRSIEQKSLFEQDISPFTQLAWILGATLFFQLLLFVLNQFMNAASSKTYFTIALSFTLVFSIFNAILSLSAKDQNKYWLYSIISFLLICIIGGMAASLLSGQSIDEAGQFRWMYTVFTFGYLVFLTIIRAMRKIVLLAQKKDKRLRGED